MSQNLFVFLTFAVLLVFVYVYITTHKRTIVSNIGIVTLFCGGTLNLIERLRFGCVKDYLNFFGLFAFNVYDVMVSVGILLIVWNLWKKK